MNMTGLFKCKEFSGWVLCLKRHQTEKLSWSDSENVKKIANIPSACFIWLFYEYLYIQKVLSCFKFKLELLRVQTRCFALYQ